MSKLYLSSHDGYGFALNVTQFRSPMSASITTAQTKTMLQHFPIRCGQPDIQFTVMFRGQQEKHDFQSFVREHQVSALTETDTHVRDVNLLWPERNIMNWTGYISTYKVDERRYLTAQSVTFGVDLVNSLLSTRTTISSRGTPWQRVAGPQIAPWRIEVDGLFALPFRVAELTRKAIEQGLPR